MSTPIPIPDDATPEQVAQLIDDARAWQRARTCQAWLAHGPQCQAGATAHDQHWGTMMGTGQADGVALPVTVYWSDPQPAT